MGEDIRIFLKVSLLQSKFYDNFVKNLVLMLVVHSGKDFGAFSSANEPGSFLSKRNRQ